MTTGLTFYRKVFYITENKVYNTGLVLRFLNRWSKLFAFFSLFDLNWFLECVSSTNQLVFFYWLEESSQDSLKQTKDGGWICGEDIDVSVDEGSKNDTEVQEEVLPLEVQLGKGKGWVCGASILFYWWFLVVADGAITKWYTCGIFKIPHSVGLKNKLRFQLLHFVIHCFHFMRDLFWLVRIFFFCAALQKAGEHMEDSVVAAYVSLLLGCILQDNEVRLWLLINKNQNKILTLI